MALLKRRQRARWVHPLEAVYLLGMVRAKPSDSADKIVKAEQSAIDSLARNCERWGIRRIKRSKETGAGNAYYEEDLMRYMDIREADAGIETASPLRTAS